MRRIDEKRYALKPVKLGAGIDQADFERTRCADPLFDPGLVDANHFAPGLDIRMTCTSPARFENSLPSL